MGNDRERGTDRVPGTAWLVLQREGRAIGEHIDDRGDGRREDDDGSVSGRPVERAGPGVEHVREHRPAAERMQDLGHARLHARAETGRQHDGDRAGWGRGTWGVHRERRRMAVAA